MKKIIFLDIDGVLNSRRSMIAGTKKFTQLVEAGETDPGALVAATIDPVAIELINAILTRPATGFVLSSSHRVPFLGAPHPLSAATAYLEKLGVCCDRLIGLTDNGPGCRGDQVQRWIFENPDCVDSWVILDDHADIHEYQRSRFVQCSHDDGFSLSNYHAVISLLFK